MAKILYYDLETSYIETKEKKWGVYDDNPISREVTKDMTILCFSYWWEDGPKDEEGNPLPECIRQCDFPNYVPGVENDFMVCAALWKLMIEADFTVAHNGDAFDQKKTFARMAIHGFDRPGVFPTVDTKKVCKNIFGFTDNRLDGVARQLGVGRKGDAGGIQTWYGCIAGDMESWDQMKTYNIQDVIVLRDVYLKLRPWMTNHPNIGLMDTGDNTTCEICGGTDFQSRGTKTTKMYTYRRLWCKNPNCGHWQKGAKIKG